MIEILIVPAVADSLRVDDLSKLYVDETLTRTVRAHLDQYRLLTTTLHIREPNYLGVKVHAEIVPSEYSRPEVVRARVTERLRDFISPLDITEDPEERDELLGPDWEGWPFGRNLYVAEIFSLIQRVPGVKHVLDVQLSTRPAIPREEISPETEQERPVETLEVEDAQETLSQFEEKVMRVPADTLLCSIEHEIAIAELDGDNA
jgi:hypothetical protein